MLVSCEIMDISDTNTILTELQLEQLEEHEDGQVYYTVLQEDDENFTVKSEEEFIDADNVFYLSLSNEEERETEIIETQDDQNNVENYEETSTNMELIEEVVLPDGTQAYVQRHVEQDEELYEEQEQDSFELIDDPAVLTSGIKKEVNFESDEEEEEKVTTEDFDNNLLITQDNDEEFDETKYQQVQLEDNSVALIEIGLYNSIVEQSKKRGQSSKDNVKSFPCPNDGCNKSYSTMHHLRVHMRNHTGTRPYKCKVDGCEKAFATGYSLKAHSRTHTGEKPYGCQTCFKSFKASGDLQKHIRIHTGEKPFMCPIDGCGRSFTTSNIRKVHIRSHTGERPYSCPEPGCLKAFASATNYKNHMRIHSGEKPYVCSVEGCGKRFTEYSSLYKHQMVHANSKSVKCEYCNRTLRHPSTLIAHKRTAHNIIRTETGAEIMVKMVKSSDDLPTYIKQVETDSQGESQILFVSS